MCDCHYNYMTLSTKPKQYTVSKTHTIQSAKFTEYTVS